MKRFSSATAMAKELDFETPVIALHRAAAHKAASAFLQGFPGTPVFAIKANNRPEIVQTLYDAGLRAFDVASLTEIRQASDFKDVRLYFMHPVKSRSMIAAAYAQYNVRHFVLDTREELDKILEETGQATDLELFVRMAVPNDEAECPLAGKFGTSPEDASLLLQKVVENGCKASISLHVGSQTLRTEPFSFAIDLAARVIHNAGVPVKSLDVGGGFPVQYAGSLTPDLSSFFEEIKRAVDRQNWTARPALLCEPGRALVAEAETLYVKVTGRKDNMLFINDGAFGTLFEGSQMYYGLTYPARRIRRKSGLVMAPAPPSSPQNLLPYCLQGPTCDSADMMPGPYYLPLDMEEGDVLEIRNIGAYGTVLSCPFNGYGHYEMVEIMTPPENLPFSSPDISTDESLDI